MSSKNNTVEQFKTKFPASNVDEMIAEASAGQHQRLVCTQDGRYKLIIREASGLYRHVRVLAFQGGFQA